MVPTPTDKLSEVVQYVYSHTAENKNWLAITTRDIRVRFKVSARVACALQAHLQRHPNIIHRIAPDGTSPGIKPREFRWVPNNEKLAQGISFDQFYWLGKEEYNSINQICKNNDYPYEDSYNLFLLSNLIKKLSNNAWFYLETTDLSYLADTALLSVKQTTHLIFDILMPHELLIKSQTFNAYKLCLLENKRYEITKEAESKHFHNNIRSLCPSGYKNTFLDANKIRKTLTVVPNEASISSVMHWIELLECSIYKDDPNSDHLDLLRKISIRIKDLHLSDASLKATVCNLTEENKNLREKLFAQKKAADETYDSFHHLLCEYEKTIKELTTTKEQLTVLQTKNQLKL